MIRRLTAEEFEAAIKLASGETLPLDDPCAKLLESYELATATYDRSAYQRTKWTEIFILAVWAAEDRLLWKSL